MKRMRGCVLRCDNIPLYCRVLLRAGFDDGLADYWLSLRIVAIDFLLILYELLLDRDPCPKIMRAIVTVLIHGRSPVAHLTTINISEFSTFLNH